MNLSFSGEFDNTIHIEEHFRAPREKLFQVWTEADRLKNWFMAEEGFVVTSAEVDLRIDGPYRLGVTPGQGGDEMEISGDFMEIARPEKLAYTWTVAVLDGKKTLVKVAFSEHENGSKIDLVHGVFDTPEQTRLHAEGWAGCIAHLSKYVDEV